MPRPAYSFHYCSLCAHVWHTPLIDSDRRGVLRPCPDCETRRVATFAELKAAA